MNAPANITIEVGLVFNTFEEVQDLIERYAIENNIVTLPCRTTKTSGNIYKQVTFVCEKGGKYRGKKTDYFTKRTNCPFTIRVYYRKRERVYMITSVCLDHNHKLLTQVHKHLFININNCATISTLIVYGIGPKIQHTHEEVHTRGSGTDRVPSGKRDKHSDSNYFTGSHHRQ